MGLVWESSFDSKLDEASWELASVLSPGSVVRAVEEEAVTSEWAMLARWMGTGAAAGARLLSGGARRKGATMACGTLRMRHSWPAAPRNTGPGLLQKLPRGPRSTRRIGSVGSGLSPASTAGAGPGVPQKEEMLGSWLVSPALAAGVRGAAVSCSCVLAPSCLHRWEWRSWRLEVDLPSLLLLPRLEPGAGAALSV